MQRRNIEVLRLASQDPGLPVFTERVVAHNLRPDFAFALILEGGGLDILQRTRLKKPLVRISHIYPRPEFTPAFHRRNKKRCRRYQWDAIPVKIVTAIQIRHGSLGRNGFHRGVTR